MAKIAVLGTLDPKGEEHACVAGLIRGRGHGLLCPARVRCRCAMDYDLMLIVGLVLIVLALPSLLAALIEDRLPLAAGTGLALGTGLAGWAVVSGDRGLDPRALPDVLFTVIGRYLL